MVRPPHLRFEGRITDPTYDQRPSESSGARVVFRFAGRMQEKADPTLLPDLREAEAAYHAEREEYLSQQLAVGSRQEEEAVDADALIAQLPAEIIQQIVNQTGAPADWRQWPEELKVAVVQAIQEAQGS